MQPCFRPIAAVVWSIAVSVASAAPATSTIASLGLTSTRPSGVVSIQTDPALSDGRLVMKVAAHNTTERVATLTAADVRVLLGDKPIPVLSLDDLIAEVRGTTA